MKGKENRKVANTTPGSSDGLSHDPRFYSGEGSACEQPGGQEVCVYGLSKAIIPHFLSSQPKDQETERGKLKFKVKTKGSHKNALSFWSQDSLSLLPLNVGSNGKGQGKSFSTEERVCLLFPCVYFST